MDPIFQNSDSWLEAGRHACGSEGKLGVGCRHWLEIPLPAKMPLFPILFLIEHVWAARVTQSQPLDERPMTRFQVRKSI